MNINEYQTITGITVPASRTAIVTATLASVQYSLEMILGYSLNAQAGSSTRIYPYSLTDRYIEIDPADSISEVKVMRNGVLANLYDADDYMLIEKFGFVKYIEVCEACFFRCKKCNQYYVTGEFNFATLPADLANVFAQMVTFYSDPAMNIKSQSLGTHSYTKGNIIAPEDQSIYKNILLKYAGPNGTLMTPKII